MSFYKKSLAAVSIIFMLIPLSVNAGLANAMDCHKNLEDKTCSALLIGHIDALMMLQRYCPDGNTSYKFLQQAWARDVIKDENLLKLGTTLSIQITMSKLNLLCKK